MVSVVITGTPVWKYETYVDGNVDNNQTVPPAQRQAAKPAVRALATIIHRLDPQPRKTLLFHHAADRNA